MDSLLDRIAQYRGYLGTHVMKTVFIVALVLAVFPHRTAAEDFEGQTALIKRLLPEEKLTYFGLQYQLNKYQIRQYLSLETPDERAAWVDRFWINLDPTPTTEVNERRIEHEKRVSLARKLFGMKKAPGWDKRGETLIRWGMPKFRAETSGNIGFYEMIPPGEIWYYTSLDMLVSFHDFGLKGEHIYAIEPYGRTARQELERLKNVNDLYKAGIIQQLHPTDYMDFDEIKDLVDFNPDQIDYIADPDVRMEMPRDLIAVWEQEKVEKSANNFHKYLKEKPIIYSIELDRELLPLYFDVTNFRGGPGRIRTEVNIEVPSSEVTFIRRSGKLQAEVDLRVVVRDISLGNVAAAGDLITAIQVGGDSYVGPSYLPGQVVLTLEPGYYRLGIEAMDRTSEKRGVYRTNLEIGSFDGTLRLSDIQFASSIRETELNTKFVKGNLQIVPHPLRAYKAPYPLTFYFEIYGLDTDNEGIAFYTIEYEIIPLQKRRKGAVLEETPAAVSSRFETSGFGTKQVQRLEIATDNLWEGPFELIITVTDRRTRRRIEKRAKFSILE